MKVLFIRHAQSTNNAVQASVEDRIKRGVLKGEDAWGVWLSERTSDAGLTERGKMEARMLGDYYGEALQGEDVLLYTSGMERTCRTAEPLVKKLRGGKIEVKVHPELYETGGVFSSKNGEHFEGKTRTAAEITNDFGYDTSLLPQTGMWYKRSKPFETNPEAVKRSVEVVKWLTSDSLRKEVGDRLLVIMCHQALLSLIFKELSGATATVHFNTQNTATTFAHVSAKKTTFIWIGGVDHITRNTRPPRLPGSKL